MSQQLSSAEQTVRMRHRKWRSFGVHFRENTGLGRAPEDAVVFWLIASMFTHWLWFCAVLLYYAVRLLICPRRLAAALQPRVPSYFFLGIAIVLFLVSVLQQNYLSAATVVGIVLIVLVAFWVRSFMTRHRYERMLDLCVMFSFVSALISLIQKWILLPNGLLHHFVMFPLGLIERIVLLPMGLSRVDFIGGAEIPGPTLNANYYGLQLVLVILAALFRLFELRWEKRVFFYLSCVILNLYMLLLTQSYTGIVGLFVGVMLLLFFYRYYKALAMFIGGLTAGFSFILSMPSAVARYTIFNSMLDRIELWKIAWHSIRESASNLWFGQGFFSFQKIWDVAPRTFWDVRGATPRAAQPHCHSLYLELFLSIGLFGVLLVCIFCLMQLRTLLRRGRVAQLKSYSGFFLICTLAVAVANVADATLFWVQSGFLFLLFYTCIGIASDSGFPDD